MRSPLDLTKVRLQATGDKSMIESIKKTVRTAGVRGLFDGISGTWMRQMSYSLCRFWAYDESKKLIGAGTWVPALPVALANGDGGGHGDARNDMGILILVDVDDLVQIITRPHGCWLLLDVWVSEFICTTA